MKQGQDYAAKRGRGSIEKRTRKDGGESFIARWHDGERSRNKTFRTLEAAEDHLQKVDRDKLAGRYIPESDHTIVQVVSDYIDRRASHWSPNTVANYRQILRTIIEPAFKRKKAVDLTSLMVQSFIQAQTRVYSPRRVEVIRAVLSGAFKEARVLGITPTNPAEGIRGAKVERTERVIWTSDQAVSVLEAVETNTESYAWYRVALDTGMRPGELRALQWGDIDMERAVIHVRRSVSRDAAFRQVIGASTKTNRARSIDVAEDTIKALRRYRAVQDEERARAVTWRDLDLVFTRGDGNLLPQQTIAKRHKRVCQRAGVPVISPHGIRHTAATMMLEAGIDIKTISDRLGHASISITLDIYTKSTVGMQRSAAEKMGELLRRRPPESAF